MGNSPGLRCRARGVYLFLFLLREGRLTWKVRLSSKRRKNLLGV